MISHELKTVILGTLKVDDWELTDTLAAEVPGWDSLSHINVVMAVEKHFGVRFKNAEVLRLKNIGDLQRLVDSKLGQDLTTSPFDMALSFTSLEFILFSWDCVSGCSVEPEVCERKWVLIIFSYVFYLSFGIAGVLVVTLTALVDFIVGRRLGNSVSTASRRALALCGSAVNLGPLIFLKYSVFLSEIIAALRTLGVHVWLPLHPLFPIVGLSYFTFAGMSYVLDVYNETIEPTQSMSDYLCYLVYFPKLVAGPIVRATEFLPQLSNGIQITAEDFEIGCAYLLVGAVKKLVIADQLASHVGMILAAPQATMLHAGSGNDRIHGTDLCRFFRLLRHGDRVRTTDGYSISSELSNAIQFREHRGVLATVACDHVELVQGLCVPTVGAGESRNTKCESPSVSEHCHHHASLRPLARSELELRAMGRTAWCGFGCVSGVRKHSAAERPRRRNPPFIRERWFLAR